MTREEKVEKIKTFTDTAVLDCYTHYVTHFNPVDADFCESYEVVKAEILRRMGGKA